MRDFLKRYRELIVVGTLLVLPVIVWLTHSKHGRGLNTLDRAILWVTSPVERLVSASASRFIDVMGNITELRHAREQNLELRRRIVQLEGETAELGEVRAENGRLRDMLSFAKAPPAPVVPARVIGEGLSRNLLTLTIDKGADDGLKPNMAVVTHQGVVGRLVTVAGGTSSLMLLSDMSSSVPVRVQRTRARGTVVGQGSGKDFTLTRMLRTDDIQDGDLLVTSGTDGVFPKGLPVGRAAGVQRPHHGMFLEASVVPAVNLTCPDSVLEELFVVTSLTGESSESAPDAAQADGQADGQNRDRGS